jgi:hypothetical protein
MLTQSGWFGMRNLPWCPPNHICMQYYQRQLVTNHWLSCFFGNSHLPSKNWLGFFLTYRNQYSGYSGDEHSIVRKTLVPLTQEGAIDPGVDLAFDLSVDLQDCTPFCSASCSPQWQLVRITCTGPLQFMLRINLRGSLSKNEIMFFFNGNNLLSRLYQDKHCCLPVPFQGLHCLYCHPFGSWGDN